MEVLSSGHAVMGDLYNEPAPRAVMGDLYNKPAARAVRSDLTDARVNQRAAIGVVPDPRGMMGDLADSRVADGSAIGAVPAPRAMTDNLTNTRITELSAPVANTASRDLVRLGALETAGKTYTEHDGNNIATGIETFNPLEQHGQYEDLSDNELSHELLRMIVKSVQKTESRRSCRKTKRKRVIKARTETNGSEADDEHPAYSRCSISFLFKVLEKVRSCPKYVELVKWMGFGDVLHLDDCCIPRGFVKWIADNVCTDDEEIRIGSKSIKLSPQSVTDTLGTPTGPLPVESDEMTGKAAFLALFGLSEVPSIRYFGKIILAKEILADDVFCRCFMSVCLGTFFCPNSNTKLSTKYMGALVVVAKIKDRNWSKFIHEWMIEYIKKFLKESVHDKKMTQTLGGCIYHAAVRVLDFIDFGPIQLPSTLPRIKVWKGNLIKVFSDMYMGTSGKYGAYPIKDISQTCYFTNPSIHTENGSNSDEALKQTFDAAVGDLVVGKVKDAITAAFVSIMKDEDRKMRVKAQDLVCQVLHVFLSNQNGSQETEKISCSC